MTDGFDRIEAMLKKIQELADKVSRALPDAKEEEGELWMTAMFEDLNLQLVDSTVLLYDLNTPERKLREFSLEQLVTEYLESERVEDDAEFMRSTAELLHRLARACEAEALKRSGGTHGQAQETQVPAEH